MGQAAGTQYRWLSDPRCFEPGLTGQSRPADSRHRSYERGQSKGVTSFQDAGSSFETISRFKRLADHRKLKLRLWVMVRESNDRLRERLAEYRMIGYGRHRLTVRGIKRMVDGALGSHGAWLLEPYNDLPNSRGLNVESVGSIKETALLAIKHDYQLCVQAKWRLYSLDEQVLGIGLKVLEGLLFSRRPKNEQPLNGTKAEPEYHDPMWSFLEEVQRQINCRSEYGEHYWCARFRSDTDAWCK